MHKANVRANNRLWYQYSKAKRCTSPITERKIRLEDDRILKYLYIITRDDAKPMCSYENKLNSNRVMSEEMIEKCLDFCFRYHLAPVFIGETNRWLSEGSACFSISDNDMNAKSHATVFTSNKAYLNNNIIITINREEVTSLCEKLSNILNEDARVNIFVTDIDNWSDNDFSLYYEEVSRIAEKIMSKELVLNASKINLFKESDHSKMRCGAGRTSITVAPDGDIYLCPAFYFEKNTDSIIGNINDDVEYCSLERLDSKRLPMCINCGNNCNVCAYENLKTTGELNIPSEKQCRIQTINRDISIKMKLYK